MSRKKKIFIESLITWDDQLSMFDKFFSYLQCFQAFLDIFAWKKNQWILCAFSNCLELKGS